MSFELILLQFFFISWGSKIKSEQINGIKLSLKCSCKSSLFNIYFDLKRHYLFWIIPLGDWDMENISLQCVKCGKTYVIEGRLYDELEKQYWKLKEKEKI